MILSRGLQNRLGIGRHRALYHGWLNTRSYSLQPKSSRFSPSDPKRRPQVKNLTNEVKLSWDDGKKLALQAMYLRDHCNCPHCRNEITKQRKIDCFSVGRESCYIPLDIAVADLQENANGISITWKGDLHKSSFGWEWLRTRAQDTKEPGWNHVAPQYFDATIAESPPTIEYQKVMSNDQGVGEWATLIRKHGFCYVDGCPPTPEATESLLERIAFIRRTHYGNFWDFTSDLSFKDTAYTNCALPAHTDTAYFTEPAGLQMFHLLSHTDGEGGNSLLVDGFRAAELLKKQSRKDFSTLSRVNLHWQSSGNSGVCIVNQEARPVIYAPETIGKPRAKYRSPLRIHWNDADRCAANAPHADEWYGAARKFNSILTDPKSEYWAQLKPGRPLIFDNWRVLHGRSAFTGKRRLCGGYINMDDFLSRWRLTTGSYEPDAFY